MSIREWLLESTRVHHERGWITLGLAVSVLAAYVLAFVPPFTPDGYGFAELAATPVVVFAWLFGLRGAAAAVVIVVPLNAALFALTTGAPVGTIVRSEDDLLLAVAVVVLGVLLGGLRDLGAEVGTATSARQAAEAARRRSDERLAFVAERVADGVLALDADGTVTSGNPAAAGLLGVEPDELRGRTLASFLAEAPGTDPDAGVRRHLARVSEEPGSALRVPGTARRPGSLEILLAEDAHDGRRAYIGVVRAVESSAPGRPGTRTDSAAPAEDPPLPGTTRSGPKVLYIAGGPASLERVEGLRTERPTLRLLTASDGGRGLDLARAERPDAVVLALELPDIHGSEVMRRIREDPLTSRTPVVVVGVDPNTSDGLDLLEAGADACLTEPVAVPELVRALDRALEA